MLSKEIEREKNVVSLIALVIGAMFITAILLVLTQVIILQHMNQLYNVVCVSISTICGFVLFPIALMRCLYTLSLQAIGICKPVLYDWVALVIATVVAISVLVFSRKQTEWLLLMIVQNLIVAGSEEFLCRGSLIFILGKTIKNRILVGITAIIIFVFIIHSNATIVENLIWRLPVSVLIVCIYMKRKSIYLPIAIHFTYNIIVSSN